MQTGVYRWKKDREQIAEDRVVVEATLVRPLGPLGYARTANGTFVPTDRVRLVYERKQCDARGRARNEVITMFPI